jgi:hypothetical protein
MNARDGKADGFADTRNLPAARRLKERVMPKTFTGTYAVTQTLSSSLDAPATIAASARLNAGLVATKLNWYIQNFGSITHTVADGGGAVVAMNHYGHFTNKATGVIHGTGAGSVGVDLNGGDMFGVFKSAVTNLSGGTIAAEIGVRGLTDNARVVNAGQIQGTMSNGSGVVLEAGGFVTNQSTGTISGNSGIRLANGGTAVNAGAVTGNSNGVLLQAGGIVTNQASGVVTASTYGVRIIGTGTLTNAGSITASPGAVIVGPNFIGSSGAALLNGGALSNQSTGVISGARGVWAKSGVTVTNAGTLTGAGISGRGVDLNGGGLITNTGLIQTTGSYGTGVRLVGGGTLTNAVGATIVAGNFGLAVDVADSAAAVISNAGSILGDNSDGVSLGAGTLTNLAGGFITGFYGVSLDGGTVQNAGTINGIDRAVRSAGGVVVNQGGGVLTGKFEAVNALDGTTTVTNQAAGTISGGNGIVVSNFGTATIVNSGVVTGTSSTGISVLGTAAITNEAGGTISGVFGIRAPNAMAHTIVNRGSIAGSTKAIEFGDAANHRLVVEAGAAFTGLVDGGAATTDAKAATLQLTSAAATGTLSGLGTQFVNFGKVGIDSGARWVMPSATLQSGATLTNAGSILSAVTLAGVADVTIGAGALVGSGSGGLIGAGAGAVTLTTSGAINGGAVAVDLLAGAAHRMIVNPGASFTGTVSGGNTAGSFFVSTLQLKSAASTGTLSGLGTQITDFGLTQVDAGASWVLSDANIEAGGSLDNAGTILSGVTLEANTTLTNQSGALISAAGLGAVIGIGAGVTIDNQGSLAGDSGSGFGIYLAQGGSLTNAAGASVSGVYGAFIAGGPGIVHTAGTMTGAGAALAFTGGYNNILQVEAGAVFAGSVLGGNTLGGGATSDLTLLSSASAGTLSGLGVSIVGFQNIDIEAGGTWTFAGNALAAGYALSNQGTLTNQGSLGSMVTLGSGAVLTNDAGATIATTGNAVQGDGALVSNSGSIGASGGTGVTLGAGGTVTNTASGVLTGTDGVAISGGAGTIGNAGSIGAGGGTAVSLGAGGGVDNQAGAAISGATGVAIGGGSGTVTNAGDITAGGGAGVDLTIGGSVVDLTAGGTVLNQAGATISGTHGVRITGAVGTITNQGEIAGTTKAVELAAGFANRLIVAGGAGFSGTVDGGNTIGSATRSALDLVSGASAGTLSGLGVDVINFAQVSIAAGAAWTLQGQSVTAGTTLTNSGTLTNDGSLATGVTLTAGAVLDNAVGATIVAAGAVASGAVVISPNAGAPVSLSNAGLIQATNTITGRAVYLRNGGVVNVGAAGTIAGRTALAISGGAGTVTTAGTLSGSVTALQFAAGFAHELNVEGGAAFAGLVDGGNTIGSTIVSNLNLLAAGGPGTLTGLGSQVVRFQTIAVEAGADWAVNGTVGAAYALNTEGALTNLGTIATQLTLGAVARLTNAAGGTIATGGTAAVYGHASGTSTIVNAGLITATSDGTIDTRGISFAAAGMVTNQSGGTIAGSFIAIQGGKGSVIDNAGMIGDANANLGVSVNDGFTLTNQAGGTIAAQFNVVGGGGGISGSALTLSNAGMIAAGTASGRGVDFLGAASITNAAGGTISGHTGVALTFGAGTVTNAGLIGGDSAAYGVKLGAGGLVSNSATGTINASRGVTISGNAGTLINDGIVGRSLGTYGVQLHSGGSVTNKAGGTIAGAQAVVGTGASASVVNAGSIAGGDRGVQLLAGGAVTNQSGGTITGNFGAHIAGGSGLVDNAGRIDAGTAQIGVELAAGGSVTNRAGGTISGPTGVRGAGSAVAVDNAGRIDASGIGVTIASGGTLTNRTGGTIAGETGARLQSNNDAVINAGLIQGGSYHGVRLIGTGSVINQSGGTITGVEAGVYLDMGATVSNAAGGTISGATAISARDNATISNAGRLVGSHGNQVGVDLYGGATLTNLTGGTISGITGVQAFAGAATVTNAGAIDGSANAVLFQAGHAHRLVVEAGATFTGQVDGGNAIGSSVASTLRLASSASAGTLAGLGSQITQFRDIVVDAGADWTLDGVTLGGGYGIANSGTLTNTGSIGSVVMLEAGASLTNAATGTIAASGGGAIVNLGVTAASLTVSNAGVIDAGGSGPGIYLAQGGTITNLSDASISGGRGIITYYGPGLLTNAGSISATSGTGVRMATGGTIVNQTGGTISGNLYGIGIHGGATLINASGALITGGDGAILNQAVVDNAGTIASGDGAFDTGLLISGGGMVTNHASGVITGARAIRITGAASTVTNAGTISGTTAAVSFGSGSARRLIVDPTGSFTGLVDGGNTIGSTIVSTLQLSSAASSGTIAGLGTQFINFARTEIDAGGSWVLEGNNTIVAGATLTNEGTLTLLNASFSAAGAVINDGTIVIDPSVMTLAALSGTGVVEIDDGSTLTVQGAVSAGQTVIYASGTATLAIEAASFAGDILGFGIGDILDLGGVTDATAAGIVNGSTLEILRSGHAALRFELDAGRNFSGATFTLGFDDDSNFLTTDLACFVAGTLIETTRGPVVVEDLREGDVLLTAAGGQRAIRWIGWRRLDLREHPKPALAQPIRIHRDAFGPDLPRRDLLVSPDHALFVDGVLVPARLLVNGATITREADWHRPITYYHVELDAHDVLLAEGLAAESYLDTGNRGVFQNAGVPVMLHPDLSGENDQARRLAESCAPFADQPALVEPIWRRLSERAQALGLHATSVTTTQDPALRVIADGRTLQPVSVAEGRAVFVLPRGVRALRLISRAAAPHEVRPWIDDRRDLGVMVRRLTLRRDGLVETIPMDHPALGAGWWDLEQDARTHWRWTNGDAAVSVEPGSVGLLEVEIGGTVDYVLAAEKLALVA